MIRNTQRSIGKPLKGFGVYSAPQAVGILAAELNGPNPHSRIHNNEIFFAAGATNAYAAIHVNAANTYQVTENDIELDDINKNQYGIFMSACTTSTASCNNVTGKGNYPTNNQLGQAAIATTMGVYPTIGCNNLDHTQNGILVLSVYNAGADIHTNTFNDHVFGLHYGSAAITPPQDYKGNQWKKDGNQNGGQHAWNENYLGQFSFADPTIILNYGYEPLSQTPLLWFYKPPIPLQQDIKCSIPTFYCDEFNTLPNPIIATGDDAVIDSAIVNGAFTDETQWRQEGELLARINRYPSLLSIPKYDNFYNLRQNNFINLLQGLIGDKADLFVSDSTINVLLHLCNTNIDSLQILEREQLMQLKNAIDSNSFGSIVLIQSNLATLMDNINLIAINADSIIANREIRILQIVDDLKLENMQLNDVYIIETNEKEVTDIELETVRKNNVNFTFNQIETLHTIANQCPLAGGNAVMYARSLLYLIEGYKIYDDKNICALQGINLRQKAKRKIATASMYPNPADEKVTFNYYSNASQKLKIELYNSFGQKVYDNNLSNTSTAFDLSLKLYAPGIYCCKILSDGQSILSEKLVIIHAHE